MNFKILLTTTLVASTFAANAQNADNAYSISGSKSNVNFWANIKQVDLATGKVVKNLFDADATPFTLNYADGNKALNAQDAKPTVYGVAAAALDARHNRLYFAPMHLSEIRYLDLSKSTPEFTVVKTGIIAAPAVYQGEENHLTRMVIAADGYGYAITNDANHLIRFTTGKKAIVEDLGAIVDAEGNKTISIHNKCTSWGGDIIADAFGRLIIISANHNVFSVDVATRIAKYEGAITGLPAGYTTNGAAVDKDGNIVVSSAVVFDALYKVDAKTWAATKIESSDATFNSSDLANANCLNQKEYDAKNKITATIPQALYADVISNSSKVYPNPVTNGSFKVMLDDLSAGKYTITVTDLTGRIFFSQTANVASKVQATTVKLTAGMAKGMYLVKVANEAQQLLFTERIVVQ